MMFRRTETIKFSEFMNKEYKKPQPQKQRTTGEILKTAAAGGLIFASAKVALPALAVTIPVAMMLKSSAVSAATQAPVAVPVAAMPEAVKQKIVHAFDPLVDLMIGLSIPIASVMVTGGCLLILIGQKEAGYKLIMNSCLGYILIQLSPLMIDLLVGIGNAV